MSFFSTDGLNVHESCLALPPGLEVTEVIMIIFVFKVYEVNPFVGRSQGCLSVSFPKHSKTRIASDVCSHLTRVEGTGRRKPASGDCETASHGLVDIIHARGTKSRKCQTEVQNKNPPTHV